MKSIWTLTVVASAIRSLQFYTNNIRYMVYHNRVTWNYYRFKSKNHPLRCSQGVFGLLQFIISNFIECLPIIYQLIKIFFWDSWVSRLLWRPPWFTRGLSWIRIWSKKMLWSEPIHCSKESIHLVPSRTSQTTPHPSGIDELQTWASLLFYGSFHLRNAILFSYIHSINSWYPRYRYWTTSEIGLHRWLH